MHTASLLQQQIAKDNTSLHHELLMQLQFLGSVQKCTHIPYTHKFAEQYVTHDDIDYLPL